MTSSYSNSSRALAFLSETSEDAIAALKGLVGGVGSAKYLDTSEDKLSTISVQIDSSRDEERISALTRIVAMISKGRDVSQFLPAVLKLTSCSNLDVRKLVYIVLLRYANNNPDLTLLSINSFQRDLSDPSPLIRAMALRVLSSIKVTMVAPIVVMAVAKAARDPNLYVRKISALALPKCYQIDRAQLDTLLETLSTLLADRSPYVLGAALSAFQQVSPEKWELLHQHYRKICHALSDMDDWGQITSLQVLSRYARANFLPPKPKSTPTVSTDIEPATDETKQDAQAEPIPKPAPSTSSGLKPDVEGLEAFLSNSMETSLVAPGSATSINEQLSNKVSSSSSASQFDIDRDLELLLVKAQNLLHSPNAAVVMAATRLIYYIGPSTHHSQLARPLIRLLRSSPDIAHVVLLNILTMVRQDSQVFSPYVTAFFLGASHEEPISVSLLKLDVLVTICNKANVALVLPELVIHVRSPDDGIAAHAISCLGKLALRPELQASSKCLCALLNLLRRRKAGTPLRDITVAHAVLVVKDLIQDGATIDGPDASKTAAIVYRLAALLFGTATAKPAAPASSAISQKKVKAKVLGKGAILHPAARASILWLLGQHARKSISVSRVSAGEPQRTEALTLAELIMPDVLRRCAINFSNESTIVKLQILTASSKVFAFLPTVLTQTPGLVDGQQGRSERLASTITKLHFYLLKLARYDVDFDVRDRARFCKGLTGPLAEHKRLCDTSTSGGSGEDSGVTASLVERDTIQEAIGQAARSVGEVADDDADLKGVRLRREQVIHVLFAGKARAMAAEADMDRTGEADAAAANDGPMLGSLSLVLDGKLIKGWMSTQLPDWAEKATSADLREPPAVTTPSHPTLKNSTLANVKSFSSGDFAPSSASQSPVVLTPTIQPPHRLTPSSSRSASRSGQITPNDLESSAASHQQKYKDLDSFLDESDDDNVVELNLDDSAPEDDEFDANRWQDEEEEVSTDTEEDEAETDDDSEEADEEA